MQKKSGYIFTNKSHPEKAVMSSVLGLLSLIAIFAAIYFSFQNIIFFRFGFIIKLCKN